MSYLTNKNMKVYHDIKSGKRKQYTNRESRREISKYKQGFADGFSRGYSACLRNNFVSSLKK